MEVFIIVYPIGNNWGAKLNWYGVNKDAKSLQKAYSPLYLIYTQNTRPLL